MLNSSVIIFPYLLWWQPCTLFRSKPISLLSHPSVDRDVLRCWELRQAQVLGVFVRCIVIRSRPYQRANPIPFVMLFLWSKMWSWYFHIAEALIIWSVNLIILANAGIVRDPVNTLWVCDCSKPHWNQQEPFWTIELQTFLGVVYNATDLITMFLAGISMQMDFSAGGP